jgi:hypothetical protein
MKTKDILATLLILPNLAAPAMVQARTHEDSVPPLEVDRRELAAPAAITACMTDHGPSRCDEPVSGYGSPGALAPLPALPRYIKSDH